MIQQTAFIRSNQNLTADTYWLELSVGEIPARSVPGQFIHVKIADSHDPLLRRPLSICKVMNISGELHLGILYRVVGKGTRILSEKRIGERLDLIGPLGTGYDLHLLDDYPERPVVLVSGGIGIAPIVFLAQRLWERDERPRRRVIACVGMATQAHLVCLDELRRFGCTVDVSTDDGTAGKKGYVTGQIAEIIDRCGKDTPPLIYACGPLMMLRALHAAIRHLNLPVQISVDEMMGCGVGACLGCVIKTRPLDGIPQPEPVYKRICKDGPVFDSREIAWDDL